MYKRTIPKNFTQNLQNIKGEEETPFSKRTKAKQKFVYKIIIIKFLIGKTEGLDTFVFILKFLWKNYFELQSYAQAN